MFKLNEIKELIKLVDQTSVHELEIESEGTRLSIKKPNAPRLLTTIRRRRKRIYRHSK